VFFLLIHVQSNESVQAIVKPIITNVFSLETTVQELSRRPDLGVRRCRVCFYESEGSVACQDSRHTCSGWSDQGAGWTDSFRDDTDHRAGGCRYQWRVECQ